VALALLFALYPRKSSFPPLPDPNGYDVLVRAAARVIRNTNSVKEPTPEELAALVATNKAALLELRRGLEMPSAVPVMMSEDWFASETPNLMSLKGAAIAMVAEIRHRQGQGDLAGALSESCDLLRFGQAISRHGVWIDVLVGTACEAMAVRCMTNLLAGLTAEQCRDAVGRLERHESQRESSDEIAGREREWQRKTYGFTARFQQAYKEHIQGEEPLGKMFVPDVEKDYHTRALAARRLMLAAASRAFELERGRKPQRISELVPDYLRAVPIDPASHAPLELP
jgi:hypothetical protein